MTSVCPLPGCGKTLLPLEAAVCPACHAIALRCSECGVFNRPDANYCRGCRSYLATAEPKFTLNSPPPTEQRIREIATQTLGGPGWVDRPFWHAGSLFAMDESPRILSLFYDERRPFGFPITFDDDLSPERFAALEMFRFPEPDHFSDSAPVQRGSVLFAASPRRVVSISLAPVPAISGSLRGNSAADASPGHHYVFPQTGGCNERLAVGKHGLALIEKPTGGSRPQLTAVGWAGGKRRSQTLEGETGVAGPLACGSLFVTLGAQALWIAHSNPGSVIAKMGRLEYPRDFTPYLSAGSLPSMVKLLPGSQPFAVCGPEGRQVAHVLGARHGTPAIWSVRLNGSKEPGAFYDLQRNASVSNLSQGGLLVHEERSLTAFESTVEPEISKLPAPLFRLGFPVRRAGNWAAGFAQERDRELLLVHLPDAELRQFAPFREADLRLENIFALELMGPMLALSYMKVSEPNSIESYCWGTAGS